jgi:hypothetical protein
MKTIKKGEDRFIGFMESAPETINNDNRHHRNKQLYRSH